MYPQVDNWEEGVRDLEKISKWPSDSLHQPEYVAADLVAVPSKLMSW